MTVASIPGGAIELAYDAIVAYNIPNVNPWNNSMGKVHHGLVSSEYNINLKPNPNKTNVIECK